MQMKAELLRKGFRIDEETVPDTTFLEKRHINVRIPSAKYFPAHLNVAVRWDPCGGWHALL